MNADRYIEVVQRKVVKDMERPFPNEGGIFYARLGSLPYYKKSEKTFEKIHMNVLHWPGNSPSLNPIENFWSIAKTRLLKRDGTTKTKLIDAIIDV